MADYLQPDERLIIVGDAVDTPQQTRLTVDQQHRVWEISATQQTDQYPWVQTAHTTSLVYRPDATLQPIQALNYVDTPAGGRWMLVRLTGEETLWTVHLRDDTFHKLKLYSLAPGRTGVIRGAVCTVTRDGHARRLPAYGAPSWLHQTLLAFQRGEALIFPNTDIALPAREVPAAS